MAVWGFDCKRSKPFSYQKSVSAFLHKQKKSRLHMQSRPSWWRWFGHGESHGLKILVSAEWIKRLLRSVINTYINTINLNILNSPIFGNRKGYCKAVETAPPHLTLSAWCGVLACNILFVAEFFVYIYFYTFAWKSTEDFSILLSYNVKRGWNKAGDWYR